MSQPQAPESPLVTPSHTHGHVSGVFITYLALIKLFFAFFFYE